MFSFVPSFSKIDANCSEPFAIPYTNQEDGVRNYIPDFFVFRLSSPPELLEIKPAFRLREAEVAYKVEVGQRYAKENNCEFRYLDEVFLNKHVPLALDELARHSSVEILHKK